jgi:hypothetical protein
VCYLFELSECLHHVDVVEVHLAAHVPALDARHMLPLPQLHQQPTQVVVLLCTSGITIKQFTSNVNDIAAVPVQVISMYMTYLTLHIHKNPTYPHIDANLPS